jgi:hypothetical protein
MTSHSEPDKQANSQSLSRHASEQEIPSAHLQDAPLMQSEDVVLLFGVLLFAALLFVVLFTASISGPAVLLFEAALISAASMSSSSSPALIGAKSAHPESESAIRSVDRSESSDRIQSLSGGSDEKMSLEGLAKI